MDRYASCSDGAYLPRARGYSSLLAAVFFKTAPKQSRRLWRTGTQSLRLKASQALPIDSMIRLKSARPQYVYQRRVEYPRHCHPLRMNRKPRPQGKRITAGPITSTINAHWPTVASQTFSYRRASPKTQGTSTSGWRMPGGNSCRPGSGAVSILNLTSSALISWARWCSQSNCLVKCRKVAETCLSSSPTCVTTLRT